MARYYFDTRDAGGFHHDDVGLDCDSFEAAREQAQSVLPALARDQLPDGEHCVFACDVRDETGRSVYHAEMTFYGRRVSIEAD